MSRIVGIVQPRDDARATMLGPGTINYPASLAPSHVVEQADRKRESCRTSWPTRPWTCSPAKPFVPRSDDREDGLDMESLFTIDGSKLQAAFTIDQSALTSGHVRPVARPVGPVAERGRRCRPSTRRASAVDPGGIDLGGMIDFSDLTLDLGAPCSPVWTRRRSRPPWPRSWAGSPRGTEEWMIAAEGPEPDLDAALASLLRQRGGAGEDSRPPSRDSIDMEQAAAALAGPAAGSSFPRRCSRPCPPWLRSCRASCSRLFRRP